MKKEKIGIVACSNALNYSQKAQIIRLENVLVKMGMEPVYSRYIYAEESVFSGTGKERANALMEMYKREDIKAIFDISGGDLANEILPYLEYEVIARSGKTFWGYSDLTTVINAIYAKTGKPSGLYQIRNLIREDGKRQQSSFGTPEMYQFDYEFIQGKRMQGVVVGGNIRCLLKLAGTEYWPEMRGKILLLEARSGEVPQMVAFLSHLKQMKVFENVAGVLLGTFTAMEKEKCVPAITELIKQYAGTDLPIAKTGEIGHGADSKAIIIGKEMILE